jgi:membrane-associated phospholipid phosphatase
LSKSQVSLMAAELDGMVTSFRRGPPDRRPGWTPVTTSFPSGHAAAAAAFATGVGLEMPALAAPVGALAAAVGISRVVNDVHHPSDIAGDGQSAWASRC